MIYIKDIVFYLFELFVQIEVEEREKIDYYTQKEKDL